MRTVPVTAGEVVHSARLPKLWFTECRHEPLVRLGVHAHTRAALTFVIEGSFLETVDGAVHRCGPLSVLFKPAQLPHSNSYSAGGARSFIVELSPELITACHPYADFEHFAQADGHGARGVPAALALRLYHAFCGGQMSLELRAEEFLLELLSNATIRYRQPCGRVPGWLRRIRDRVHSDYRASLGLASLANDAGVHPVYLARAFRARFGCSIGTYLHARRMDAAVEALVCHRRPISAISAELGFHDHSHFNRVFRRVVGIAPSVLRRLAGVTPVREAAD